MKIDSPYTAYLDYLALKRHFTVDNYDFFKYNGKVNAGYASFEKRQDRYYFEKLSAKRHPHEILLANLSHDPNMWIGDIVSNEDNFKAWRRTVSSLDYVFSEDTKKLDYDDFDSEFRVQSGDHPPALKKFLQGDITKETLIILNSILKFTPHWNKQIDDTVVWPNIFFNLKKYSSFLNVDLYKYKAILQKNAS
jgi:hypothetical protein